MKFSGPLKLQCLMAAIFFLLFFGYIKVIILGRELNTSELILNTMLLFIWLGFSCVLALTFQQNAERNV